MGGFGGHMGGAAATSPAELLLSMRYGDGRLIGPPELVQRNHFA